MCKRIYKEQTSEHGEVPFFKIGTFGSIPDAFISRSLFEEYRALYPYPKPGTLLISAAGSIGRIVKYAGEEAYYQDSNIVWLEHNEVLDDEFLAAVFDRHDWTALEGSTIKRLYNKDLLDFKLFVPTASEQRKIGSLFQGLNNLITLHQRKCQCRSLCGYLSWEQRKLGELFVESDERSSTEEILSVSVANGIYPASESERDTNPGASIANYKIVRVGDIVYNSMRMWQGAVGSSRYNGIVSPAYVVAKPVVELDSTCFGYLLKRPELLYKYLCNSQGNSKDTQTLRYERFAEITAEVPSTIEEQRAISDCLEGLDHLITLHQ